MFSDKEKSTWRYWFAHWCAFQMTALNLKTWKFRFLFHDLEKPFLKMLGFKYEKIRKLHRENSRHHIEYKNPKRYDYLGMVIDWECSRFTKSDAQLNARETFERMIEVNKKLDENFTRRKSPSMLLVSDKLRVNIAKVLDELGL